MFSAVLKFLASWETDLEDFFALSLEDDDEDDETLIVCPVPEVVPIDLDESITPQLAPIVW